MGDVASEESLRSGGTDIASGPDSTRPAHSSWAASVPKQPDSGSGWRYAFAHAPLPTPNGAGSETTGCLRERPLVKSDQAIPYAANTCTLSLG